MTLTILTALLLQSMAATPDVARPDPRSMSKAEISAFNASVGSTHPYYIRCKKIADTGSLVKKVRSCRTTEEWKQAWAQGNQEARDTIEAMGSKGGNSGN